jgi:hypothetical protein
VNAFRTRLLSAVAICVFGLCLSGSTVSATATPQLPAAIQAFVSCGLAHQTAPYHKATIAEAIACAPSLPVIRAAIVGSIVPPSSFIVERTDGSAAMVMVSQPAPLLATSSLAIASSCYNTWTYPRAAGTSFIDYVSLSAAGYGNHCGYANVPATPSVYATCFVPFCSATVAAGHYDSNYARSHWNETSAAGWANISFNIGDMWFCRGYVDASGRQNPLPFCA